MADEQWLTVAEVAERLKLNPETVRRWLRKGELKGHAFGRRAGYRIRRVDLDAFLREGQGE